MFKKISLVFLIFLTFISTNMEAQKRKSDEDSERRTETRSRNWNWDWDWDFNQHSRPMIELDYGMGEPQHNKFGSTFSKVGMAELKLGYSSIDDYYDESILDFRERFFFASNISTDLKSKNNDPLILDSDLWRFGFGWRTGYGYSLGAAALVPYVQYGLTWSKLSMKEFPDSTLHADTGILDQYNKSFRFGISTESGIKLEFASFIALHAAYETNVIFPRHLFWQQAGSFAVETIGISTIDYFVDEVIDSSPVAGPIINFLLKSGYMYAFYQLKKDKMNWPFDSGSPLTYEMFKVGATFIF